MNSLKRSFIFSTNTRPGKTRFIPGIPLVACALVFFSASFAIAESADDFCNAIKEIIHNGRVDFKPIHGKLDLVSEEYFGKLTPPGLEECFGWLDGQAYHCRTPVGLDSEEASKVYETYNKTLRHCLPQRWETSERDAGRANARRIMTYASDSHFVKLSISERSKRKGWFVDFYFRR